LSNYELQELSSVAQDFWKTICELYTLLLVRFDTLANSVYFLSILF